MDIFVIFQTMIKLFLMLVVGYVLFKCKIFDEHVNKKVSSLIVNVTAPLLIINSVQSVSSGDKSIVFKLVGAGMLMYVGFIILGKIISYVCPFKKADRAIYECMCVFANTAFMGYPVLLSLFDEQSVFYASMLHLPFSLFVFTYGVICLTQKEGEKFNFNPKQLLTPGFLLIFVAVFIYLFEIQIPTVIMDTINSIGGLTSPLSMMMIGASLATYPLLSSLSDIYSYFFALIRLLLIPFITMVVCKFISMDPYFANIAIVTNAMPVASMVLMLATQYDANKEIVTKNIIVSTALSVVTIPIVATFFLL